MAPMISKAKAPMMKMIARVGLVTIFGLGLAMPAKADFNFNPSGSAATPSYSISGLGFGAGNAVSTGSIPLTLGSTFQLYFQTHLTSLVGPNAPAAVPGLNTSFQITEVATFTETVTSVTTTAAGTTATFALLPSAGSRVNIYYNNAVVFNDGAGTGFTAGNIIMSLNPTSFVSSQFTDATAGGGKPTVKFDQTSSPNYGNATADQGTGSTGINSAVTSYNTAFFQPNSGTPLLTSSLLNSNLSSVFDSIAPALLFTNPITGTTFAPNIGSNNGTSGPDFLLQVSGFTQSFTAVPEPASVAMTLLGLGTVGFGSVAARRRRMV